MHCTECGAAISDGARFCAACGASTPPAPAPPPLPAQRTRPSVVTLLAALKVVMALAWLALGFAWIGFARSAPFAAWSLAMAAACATCAYGLFALRPFGRILQIVLSCLGLVLGFPVGTVVSVLILVYMFQPGVRILFSGRPVGSLSADEAAQLHAVSRSGVATAIVVAVLVGLLAIPLMGIVAAVAVPNLLHAVDRGKQTRTIADIRSIAAAVEAYASDHRSYPVAESAEELAEQLSPAYIATMPTADGWGRPLQVRSGADGYLVYSLGKDGKDGTGSLCDDGVTSTFEDEICFADGRFVRSPAGTSR